MKEKLEVAVDWYEDTGRMRNGRAVVADVVAAVRAELLRRALSEAVGNKAEAARLLRLDYKTFYNWERAERKRTAAREEAAR